MTPDQHRLFANTATDVMRALMQSGEYDISTEEGIDELREAAYEQAAETTGITLDWLLCPGCKESMLGVENFVKVRGGIYGWERWHVECREKVS
jgi:hypothetical protein